MKALIGRVIFQPCDEGIARKYGIRYDDLSGACPAAFDGERTTINGVEFRRATSRRQAIRQLARWVDSHPDVDIDWEDEREVDLALNHDASGNPHFGHAMEKPNAR